MHHVPPLRYWGFYIGISLLYLFLKWILYSVLGWIFLTVLRLSGLSHIPPALLSWFPLFPFVLFIVYFDLSLQLTVIIGLRF